MSSFTPVNIFRGPLPTTQAVTTEPAPTAAPPPSPVARIACARRPMQTAAITTSTTTAARRVDVSDVYDPRMDRTHDIRPQLPAIARAEIDAQLVAILDARAAYGETVQQAFARKEQDLGAVFASLDPIESMVMHRRLSQPQPGDALADKFARLVIDRRNRLLAFIADARRRAARGTQPPVARRAAR